MNKNLLSVLFIFSLLSLQAQKNDDDIFNEKEDTTTTHKSYTTYKQESGDNSLEVSFNPGNVFSSKNGDAFSLTNTGIKYRSFKTDNTAFRMGIDLTYYKKSDISQEEDSDLNQLELRNKVSHYHIHLMPGFEKHYDVSNRLSPYTGIQFLVGYGHNSIVEEEQDGNSIYTITISNTYDEHFGAASLDVGAGLVAGFDYYITKKLYMGVELGFGLQYSKQLKTTYSNSNNHDFDYEMVHGGVVLLSPNMTNGNVRFGWNF